MKRKFEKQAVNRICSYLLTTAMVVGGLTLSPIDTMEVQAATVKNVTLGTQAFSTGVNESTAATVYYGSDGANPIAWRVIGYDGNGVASSSGTATLFAAKNLSTSRCMGEGIISQKQNYCVQLYYIVWRIRIGRRN